MKKPEVILDVKISVKHERPIDEKDKYFYVKILAKFEGIDDPIDAEIGWIDKVFDREKFLLKTKNLPYEIARIVSVEELSKNKYYERRDQ